MIRQRLKSGIKKGLKKVLRVDISGPQPDYGVDARHRSSTATPPPPPASPPASVAATVEEAAVEEAAPVEDAAAAEAPVEDAAAAEAPVEEAAPVEDAAPAEAVAPIADAAPAMDPTDDTAGLPLTMEAVQEILDDMVRPALQGDGGDITLLRIEGPDVYVKLVGACSSCASSIVTMKMGVEALLREEFPQMRELIQEE